MRRSLLTVVSILLIPFIAGCSAIPGLAPTPTATPPPPSATPEPPTATQPPPTATLEPTATVQPTEAPASAADPAMRVYFAPNGNLLVQTRVRLMMFDGLNYNPLWTSDIPDGCCNGLAITDTRVAFVTDHTLYNLNAETGEQLFTVEDADQKFSSVAVTSNGDTLATGEDAQIRLWNGASGEETAAFPTGDEGFENHPGTEGVTDLAFRPDGLVLYSANAWTGNVFTWAMGSNSQVATFELLNTIAFTFTPNATSVMAETIDYGFIAFDPRTGVVQGEHPDIIGATGWMSFTEDDRQILVWGYNTEQGNGAGVWEIATDTLLQQFFSAADQPAWRYGALNPGGTAVAMIDETGAEIFFFNATTGERLSTITLP